MKFEIRLERPSQLLVADGVPPTSAFYSEYTVRPAMESVRARIWATRRADHVELTVFLPPGEIRPGLGEELTAAARRWSGVVDESRRIDSRMASAVGRRLILAVLVLYVITMAAGIMIIRWGSGDQGPWVETVGQTLVIAAFVLIGYPLELAFLRAMERRTRDRRTAWLSDISIHVEADADAGQLTVPPGCATTGGVVR
jgi:hypothetical protein